MESTKGKRKKKELKKAIEISLWVNRVKYKHGLLCTFCTKIPAVFHCPECTDFYCVSCDTTAHSTKKRKDHIRTKLSKLDLFNAASIVTRAVRFYGHLRTLQAKCRAVFRRHFDRVSLCHYYYNPVYGTVSWRKPYCLRKQELFPYLEPERAATICQNVYRIWRARFKTTKELIEQYEKIFDRRYGKFYYAYNGPSKLLPRQSWRIPRFCGRRGFPKDLKPIYTVDVASLIIQRKWRALLVRRFLWALCRGSYEQIWDPVNGRWNYFHKETKELKEYKPLVMGNQPWDPHYIPDWDVERVILFLRRIGLKQYAQTFRDYGVNGRALVLLDGEDFDNLEVWNKVHRRKILMEFHRECPVYKKENMSEEHAIRRERIRKMKLMIYSAIKVQMAFRQYLARKELSLRKEIRRIEIAAANAEEELRRLSTWYAERDDIPSKKLAALNPYLDSNKDVDVPDPNDKTAYLKLPPIKSYGRNKVHLSAQGWGCYDSAGVWNSLEPDYSKLNPSQKIIRKEFGFDSNVTKFVSLKLLTNGYDGRRGQIFRGEVKTDAFDDEKNLEKKRRIKEAENKRLEKLAAKEKKMKGGKKEEDQLFADADGLFL